MQNFIILCIAIACLLLFLYIAEMTPKWCNKLITKVFEKKPTKIDAPERIVMCPRHHCFLITRSDFTPVYEDTIEEDEDDDVIVHPI